VAGHVRWRVEAPRAPARWTAVSNEAHLGETARSRRREQAEPGSHPDCQPVPRSAESGAAGRRGPRGRRRAARGGARTRRRDLQPPRSRDSTRAHQRPDHSARAPCLPGFRHAGSSPDRGSASSARGHAGMSSQKRSSTVQPRAARKPAARPRSKHRAARLDDVQRLPRDAAPVLARAAVSPAGCEKLRSAAADAGPSRKAPQVVTQFRDTTSSRATFQLARTSTENVRPRRPSTRDCPAARPSAQARVERQGLGAPPDHANEPRERDGPPPALRNNSKTGLTTPRAGPPRMTLPRVPGRATGESDPRSRESSPARTVVTR